ncbi:MAG TPA: hypothetical protein VGB45_06150 [Abditibacterium sp.]|jgi:hypothetical protein
MLTDFWQLTKDFSNGTTPYTGPEISRFHETTEAQVLGILEVLGEGIVARPATSFEVSGGVGLFINIKAGLGIGRHVDRGLCVLLTEETVPLAVPANSVRYVFVQVDIDPNGEYDSRRDRAPLFAHGATDTLVSAQLLARVTTSANAVTLVEDMRAMLSTVGTGVSPGGSLEQRTVVLTSSSLASFAVDAAKSAKLARGFTLSKASTNRAAWVRLYANTASRTADLLRGLNDDPAEGVIVALEFITSDNDLVCETPNVLVSDSQITNLGLPATIINLSPTTGTVSVTFDFLSLQPYSG